MTASNAQSRRFLTLDQLRERWGNCSRQTIESRIRNDPLFPAVHRIGPGGRVRLFDEEQVVTYERAGVVREPKKRGAEAAA
jgi:hypothetical protein